jgi:hypothetical protein
MLEYPFSLEDNNISSTSLGYSGYWNDIYQQFLDQGIQKILPLEQCNTMTIETLLE